MPEKKKGGNKKVYVGPKNGKFIYIYCDGKKMKKYLSSM